MVTPTRAPDTEEALAPRPKLHLACLEVPLRSWEGALAAALGRLLSNPPRGSGHFPRVVAHSIKYGSRLNPKPLDPGSRVRTDGAATSHPLATALLTLSSPTPIQRTLGWLLLELHLSGTETDLVRNIAQWLRGIATSRADNKLVATIGDCDGLVSLLTRVATLKSQPQTGHVITGHLDFDRQWENSLEAIVHRLIRYRTEDDDEDELASTPTLDSPESLPTPPLAGGSQDEPDDELATDLGSSVADATAADTHAKRRASAFMESLYRGACPELLRDPRTILPQSIVSRAWHTAITNASTALEAKEIDRAESQLAHVLAIEAGITEREVRHLSFGQATRGKIPVIDIRARALRRPELRPTDAFSPSRGSELDWLPTGGDILFPLSAPVLRCLSILLWARRRDPKRRASSLLISRAEGRNILRNAITEAGFAGTIRASDYRSRLAATLAERLGPDAAQVAFGDSFGASAAPTYYCAFFSRWIAEALAEASALVTGQPSASPKTLASCNHWLGSRVRPRDEPYRAAWQLVGVELGRSRGRPSTSIIEILSSWRVRRDCLAVHLLLATGHRPHHMLCEIRLSDFLPRARLVLVKDKQSDPSRMTRLVATGHRFVGALEQFVEEIRRISRSPSYGHATEVARAILRGELPLFALPCSGDGVERLSVNELIRTLPAPWHDRPNLHRHALNQALIVERIDPEHRYFQMGWLSGEIHAVSEASPYPPQSLGIVLADPIDRWLASIGWQGGRLPEDRDSIFSEIRLRDLQHYETGHVVEHGRRIHELRIALAERRKAAAKEIHERLLQQFEEIVPSLNAEYADERRRTIRLRAHVPASVRPRLDLTKIEDLLAPFRMPPFQPIHAFLAPRILSSVLVRAIKEGQCFSALPTVKYLAASSVPSPFVAGVGLAVEFSRRLRATLQHAATRTTSMPRGDERNRHLAILMSWALLTHTPHRHLGTLRSLLRSLEHSTYSRSRAWLLRLPSKDGHLAITGVPALLVHRLMREPGWHDAINMLLSRLEEELGDFLLREMPEHLSEGTSAGQACAWMITALRLAAAVELNGAERLLSTNVVSPSTVSPSRACSAEDGASVAGEAVASAMPDEDDGANNEIRRTSGRPIKRGTERVRDLMRCFNPSYDGLIGDAAAKPAEHRVSQLLPLVEQEILNLRPVPTLGLLVLEYVRQLLTRGGPKKARSLRVSTIYKIYHCISPTLASIAPDRDVRELTTEEWSTVIWSALTRTRAKDKAAVIFEVKRFLDYSGQSYPLAEPDWDLLRHSAGEAIIGKDPAVISDAEIERIFQVLEENVQADRLVGVDPVDRRLRELQFAVALLLEASGIRPRSAFGLTIADIHLTDGGDYVHLKTQGPFASLKTSTSAGFVPLDGRYWQKHRAWFIAWYKQLRASQEEVDPHHCPLFQEPHAPVGHRVRLEQVTGRIGELVRWSTLQPRGRTYWLRKRRIGMRHAMAFQAPARRARDVYRVLKTSGHVSVATPIASYIGDSSAYLAQADRLPEATRRLAASAFSGTDGYILDQRWYRLEHRIEGGEPPSESQKLASVLLLPAPSWSAPEVPEPPPYTPWRHGLSWTAGERVLASLSGGVSAEDASMRTGVDIATVNQIAARAKELELRTGLAVDASGPLRRPRSTPAAKVLMSRVAAEDSRLAAIALEWVNCARIRPTEDGCTLIDPEAINLLRALLSENGFEVSESRKSELPVAVRPCARQGTDYGAWPALRWALAIAWVMREFPG